MWWPTKPYVLTAIYIERILIPSPFPFSQFSFPIDSLSWFSIQSCPSCCTTSVGCFFRCILKCDGWSITSRRWNLRSVHPVICCSVSCVSTLVRLSTCSMTVMPQLSRSRWLSGPVPSICQKKSARLLLLLSLCRKTSTSLTHFSRRCREFCCFSLIRPVMTVV